MLGFIAYWLVAQAACAVYVVYGAVTGKGRIWDITYFLGPTLMATKHEITRKSVSVNSKPTMFIMNHRSWSDFTIDSALLGGPAYLSRYAVILGVPMPVLVSWLNSAIWLFERKPGIKRDWLTEFFRTNMAMRPHGSVIVYPEGTRNTKKDFLPLKTGVFECAWNLNIPVQAIITTNKELCLNEKTFKFSRNVLLRSSISRVIHSHEYNTKEDFFAGCKAIFEDSWNDAYNCDDKDTIAVPMLPLPGVVVPSYETINPSRLLAVRILLLLCFSPVGYHVIRYLIARR